MTSPVLSDSQEFIFISRYARWIESEGRRENDWSETTSRYFSFFKERFGNIVPKKIWQLLEFQVNSMGAMPSMRAVHAAGPALEKNNACAFNCTYLPFIDLFAPAELLFLLMSGCGVGFSTEKQYINRISDIPNQSAAGGGTHVVEDSREGWANSLKIQLESLWRGEDIEFDYSLVRPRGTRLVTMGGRASGSDPLKKLHEFVRATVLNAQGRKLNSLEWLDIGNEIGDAVVAGGIRRSAEINFSDLDDELIRNAKTGSFHPRRFNSNNSAVYFTKPESVLFMKEWSSLAASGSGERGIFNLSAVKNHLPSRRKFTYDFRGNPCGEILLRPFQMCNLSEVVVRSTDSFDDLVNKVKAAVWIGTMQSTMTDFTFIRKEFKENCDEERLLGVSLTGQMDNPSLMTEEKLEILKKYAIKECKKACTTLGINMSVSITTTKPSGTVSQLVGSSSGVHARFSPYYIRRYRISGNDPLFKMMRDQGVVFKPENGQETLDPKDVMTWVCSFPIKSPDGAITTKDISAIDQLKWYMKIRSSWAEHNVSCTVYVKDSEWMQVGSWVYDHFDDVIGISFLPFDGGNYLQAPYQAISKEQYEEMVKRSPKVDYTKLSEYEMEDTTSGSKEVACQGGVCEL